MAVLSRFCAVGALLLAGCQPVAREYAWQDADGYRLAPLDVRSSGDGFAPRLKTGITFANDVLGEAVVGNRHLLHGSGVALGDADGDGRTDVYLASLQGDNKLYRNLGGWRFEDITEQAGVAAPDRYGTGATFADIDGDGDQDLLVTALGGPNAAYVNDGSGVFTEATAELGLTSSFGSTTQALADVDGDGDLDLYVANYKRVALRDSLPPDQIAWDRVIKQLGDSDYYVAPEFRDHYELKIIGTKLLRLETAEPDAFYLNDGTGRFDHISLASERFLDAEGKPLAKAPKDWGLVVRLQDVNGDGHPDLYVCNDFESPDYFFLNQGDGTFRQEPALSLRKTSNSTMAVAFSDIDRNGTTDFFTADMLSRDYQRRQVQMGTRAPIPAAIGAIDNRPQEMQNMLFLGRGDGTFAEVAYMADVAASEWTWASLFMDVDLDGYEDLLVTNGHAFDVQNADAKEIESMRQARVRTYEEFRKLLYLYPPLELQNVAFRNNGDGTFAAQPDGWGLGLDPDISHGIAHADLDHDGDLDVIVNRLNAPALVLENTAGANRVLIRLRGAEGNTHGIGAKVTVYADGLPTQTKEIIAGGVYLSSSAPEASFGTGDAAGVDVKVQWPGGAVTMLSDLPTNHAFEIQQDEAASPALEDQPAPDAAPMWQANALSHTHAETAFDDFAAQPLLARRLSQDGPGMAWADLDGDGDDDLLIGSGAGGALAMYRNERGTLRPMRGLGDLDQTAAVDQSGILAIPDASGRMTVFVGFSNYEAAPGTPSMIGVYQQQRGTWRRVAQLDGGASSIGALAAADVDGDGDLDLFAAGRSVPGQYPAKASSRLFVQDAGAWSYSPGNAAFQNIGLVTSAVFGDLDADSDADLVLATEWGPVRVMHNDGTGRFTDASVGLGLAQHTGWWRGIDLGDFDGDGRLDIAATNWGLNSRWQDPEATGYPVKVWHGNLDGDDRYDLIESRYQPSVGGYAPDRGLGLVSYGMPLIRMRIKSHEDFATRTTENILSTFGQRATVDSAATLAHTVFFNRGDRFEAARLPVEAQRAPGFGLVATDFDADGHTDLLLAQNFFATQVEIPRLDAGRGLLLKGNGKGQFEAVPGQASGVLVYGEQRGLAVSDLDQDGQLDAVFSQNGAEMILLNSSGAPAVRVAWADPQAAIGATVRGIYADGAGAAHVVKVGSGWWSQQALDVLLARDGLERVEVRWPDGQAQVVPVEERGVLMVQKEAAL